MKTPEERGPFGWWAYESRDILDLSPESVVRDLGKYNPATLRKAESNPDDMSGPLWRALVPYYQRIARKQGIILRQPPIWGSVVESGAGDTAALIAVLERHTEAMTKLADEMRQVYLAQVQVAQLIGARHGEQDDRDLEGTQTGTPSGRPAVDQSAAPEQPSNGRGAR